MRRMISLLVIIVMMMMLSTTISADNTVKVTVTDSQIALNGQWVWMEGYNIKGNNYFRLRDLAQNLTGTNSQFEVEWNKEKNAIEIITGRAYTPAAQPETDYSNFDFTAVPSTSKVVINDQFQSIAAYNINGNNYFQLRDLSTFIPYDLVWIAEENIIHIYSQSGQDVYRTDVAYTASSIAALDYYPRWSETITSYLVNNNDNTVSVIGTIGRSDDTSTSTIKVETYDHVYKLIANNRIEMELPIFGGFLKGVHYNYVAYGQLNTEEDNDKEVIRIVRYDQNFKRVDSVSIKGGDSYTTIPFDAGSGRMAENGNTLIFHTSRERYTSEDGRNHQSQLTIIVDTSAMRVTNDLGLFQSNHVSHSFDQYALFDGSSHVLVDHGDAYPRSIALNKGDGSSYTEVNLFEIPGQIGANMTGVSIGGFESSADHYLVAMNSINHSLVTQYTSFDMIGLDVDQRDIIMSTVPKNNLSDASVHLITLAQYIGSEHKASVPQLVRITDNRFMVLWQEFDMTTSKPGDVKYVYIDGRGNTTTKILTLPHYQLSTVQPILFNNSVVWYTNEGGTRVFYTIPLN